jgi:voltage-gated potassium channel
VLPEEVGRSLDSLGQGVRGLRVVRGGREIGFWEAEAQRLELGDMIVTIVATV